MYYQITLTGIKPSSEPMLEFCYFGPLGTNFSEILIEILTVSLKKMRFESVVCEMAAILSRPQRVKIVMLWCMSEIRRWIHFLS